MACSWGVASVIAEFNWLSLWTKKTLSQENEIMNPLSFQTALHYITLHYVRYITLYCATFAGHYIMLYDIALLCIILHYISLKLHKFLLIHTSVLHYIILHYTMSCCIALHCIIWHYITLHCTSLHHVALHYITLYELLDLELHCITLFCFIIISYNL